MLRFTVESNFLCVKGGHLSGDSAGIVWGFWLWGSDIVAFSIATMTKPATPNHAIELTGAAGS
jgi:hypothetical protein